MRVQTSSLRWHVKGERIEPTSGRWTDYVGIQRLSQTDADNELIVLTGRADFRDLQVVGTVVVDGIRNNQEFSRLCNLLYADERAHSWDPPDEQQ